MSENIKSAEVPAMETTTSVAGEVKMPDKKLTNINFKYGALVTGTEVVYAMALSAKVAENKKTGFGSFGSSMFGSGSGEESSSEDSINTILLANVKPDGTIETVEVTEKAQLFGWLSAIKDAKYEMPTYLNDTLRDIVGKNMADFKGTLKVFEPIKDEYLPLLSASALVTEAVKDFEMNALSLRDAVVTAKKSGGNLGLDSFIDRYAFNNHILLAGPRGVKFLHDTIAA